MAFKGQLLLEGIVDGNIGQLKPIAAISRNYLDHREFLIMQRLVAELNSISSENYESVAKTYGLRACHVDFFERIPGWEKNSEVYVDLLNAVSSPRFPGRPDLFHHRNCPANGECSEKLCPYKPHPKGILG